MSNLDFMNEQLKEKDDKNEEANELLDNINYNLKQENNNAIVLLTILYLIITTTLIIILFI